MIGQPARMMSWTGSGSPTLECHIMHSHSTPSITQGSTGLSAAASHPAGPSPRAARPAQEAALPQGQPNVADNPSISSQFMSPDYHPHRQSIRHKQTPFHVKHRPAPHGLTRSPTAPHSGSISYLHPVTDTWEPTTAGILRLPSGRLVRGRALKHPLPPGPLPTFALYLLGQPPPPVEWDHTWIPWPDFRLPSNPATARHALQDAWKRAETERVEIACTGGRGRTGTALA